MADGDEWHARRVQHAAGRAALWRHYGDRRRAEVAAARAGQFVGPGIIGLGAAERLLWRFLGGLWLILIGWFLISAAGAERRFTTASSAPDGVRVADVMTADPLVVHRGSPSRTSLTGPSPGPGRRPSRS
ncbi:MAG TPA: hypothetical protein VGF32_27800 [Streptosporangiaceae bacterium]